MPVSFNTDSSGRSVQVGARPSTRFLRARGQRRFPRRADFRALWAARLVFGERQGVPHYEAEPARKESQR